MGIVTVEIHGRTYKIACDDAQEAHLTRLARYIDKRMNELVDAVGEIGDMRLLLMASLLVADELADVYTELDTIRSHSSPADSAYSAIAEHDIPEMLRLSDTQEPLSPDFFGRTPETLVAASDRLVKRSDNERYWDAAITGIEELKKALEAANTTGDLSEAEFEQKLNEVRALQIMLSCSQIHWEVLDQFSEKTVKFLAVRFADNAIGYAASGLLGYLLGLLGTT